MKIRQLTFRCTQKTRDLFGLKDRDLVETSAGDFWEWFAAAATFDRRRAVLFTHKVSLYSFWIAGIAKANLKDIESLFRQQLAATMQADGFKEEEVARMVGDGGHVFAKTNSRPVVGSMNDHIFSTEFYIRDAGGLLNADLGMINRRLNKTPMSAIGIGSHLDYPVDVLARSLRPSGAS